MITIQSIIIGLIFGLLWGNLFSDRYTRLSKASQQTNKIDSSTWFLASTSVIRYLLLAALLAILLVKKQILLPWWFGSFIAGFWITIMYKIKPKGNGGNSNL